MGRCQVEVGREESILNNPSNDPSCFGAGECKSFNHHHQISAVTYHIL